MEYDFLKGYAGVLNRQIQDVLFNELKEMNINFVTYSHYCDVDDINSAAN